MNSGAGQNEKRYRNIFHSMRVGGIYLTVNREENCIEVEDYNRAFLEITGIDKGELEVERGIANLRCGRRSLFEEIFDLKHGTDTVLDAFYAPNSRQFLVSLSFIDKDHIFALFEDRKFIRDLEENVRIERNRLLAILDGIDDVIYVSDPVTYELIYVNDSFKENWGDDVVGKRCHKVLQNIDEPCSFCTNHIVFGEKLGETYYWEFQNRVTEEWFRCADKAIQWHDGRMVRFELASNISNLKRSEASLAKAICELKRSNDELQQFAYVASHDLQEPLRMISSYTQLIEDKYRDVVDERGRKFIHYAVDGARRMQNLINDLLTFSRISTHGKAFKKVELVDVLDEVLVNLQTLINEQQAQIDIEELPGVRADHSQMVRLFQNLIHNAIKFSGEEVPQVEIRSEQKEGYAEISVKDHGIGFDMKFRDKVFVIFQTLHAKQDYGGTGIGLAVCKRIVNRHNGEISVVSEKGDGTEFKIKLPLAGGENEL